MEPQKIEMPEEEGSNGPVEKVERKVKIYRIRRKLRQVDGVGGFFESILAMMVVTMGIVLITASFTLISAKSEGGRGIDLKKECSLMVERITSNTAICSEEGVLMHDHLSEITVKEFSPNEGMSGYKVILTEVPRGGATVLLSNGTEPLVCREKVSVSVPVNIVYSDTEVKAAILSVWAW
jgi:hypothetical protein